MSDSVRLHRRQPTRLPCPWSSPGKNTGVPCHFLLQCLKVKVKLLSCVQLFATPWTAAYQAPPSMGFSRQEYWSVLPFPSPTLECYSVMNQNRIMPLTAVWMDRVITLLSKGSQREKDKYHRVSLTVVFLK